jgi:hypothetical protein
MAIEEEVRFLRDMNRTLQDKVLQIKADLPLPVPATPFGYYGDGNDQYVVRDQFGARVLVERDPLESVNERA